MRAWIVALLLLRGLAACEIGSEAAAPPVSTTPPAVAPVPASAPIVAAAAQDPNGVAPAGGGTAIAAQNSNPVLPAVPRDATLAAAPQANMDPMAAEGAAPPSPAAPLPPPAHWKGTGVLAKTPDKPPRGAPHWAAVAAEVIERDKQRFLRTTGKVEEIANPALARSTAENRARAEMSRWLGVDSVRGAAVISVWQRAKGHLFMAQVEVALPAEALAAAP